MLVLDNLHWCDEETLAFLSFCLMLDQAAPLLVTATLRDDGGDEPAVPGDWVAGMRASGLLTELALAPLEQPETARLAERVSGRTLARDRTRRCCRPRPGDSRCSSWRRCAAARTARARRRGRSATCLPCCGIGFARSAPPPGKQPGWPRRWAPTSRLDLLTEASDLDADVVVGAVDELWRHRIVKEFRDGYDFSHDLLRDAAYGQVSPPRRWLLHRRIAQGFELLHPDGTDQVAAQLAEQYARGGRPERAVAYYRRAADLARAGVRARRGDQAAQAGAVGGASHAGRESTGTAASWRYSRPWRHR